MLQLHCHKDFTMSPVESIAAEIRWQDNGILWIRYHCEVELDLMDSGGPKEPERTDNLWQTTCFELFVRHSEGPGYWEFNFAPSGQWAAYDFSAYREGTAPLELRAAPNIRLDVSEGYFALEAEVKLPKNYADSRLQLSICAIIQDIDGNKSFWALNHAPGKPDFHHGDCFALKLPPPEKL